MWLKLSNAFDRLCRKLACSEDEENFKGNQQTCPQEREENYFADAENSSCMSSEDDSASLSDPDNWSETFSACTEAEEDLEGDQLSCTQERDENYFPNTEDYSSVSYETGSALSNSESWDESLKDSSLSFPWVNSRSDKSLETIPETESTQHSYKAANSKPDVSHEILAPMTEGFTSEDSIGNSHYVRSGVCLKWNTSFSESKKTKENSEKDDHNEKQDSSEEWASDRRTSHTWLASHDDTPVRFLDVPTLNVENEESQYQDDELLETLHTNAKPQSSKSIRSATSNQQSATHPGPITQEAAQSPLSNPLWNGDSKLNMALPQCGDEEIHSVIEGEGLASWFELCGNKNTGKNERSRWEMSSIEPNKTDGGVEKDVFDSEEDLSQEQGFFFEQGNSHVHLSLPDDTSVQSRRPEVENEEIQDTPLCEAAGNGHTDIVRLLIENGADVNEGERDTPLCKAAENGHTDIVRLLIENGADINKGEWFTPLCEAAGNGHTDIVRLLIENGAEVNKSGSDTLLFEATRNGHTDIVRLLMVKGADVNKEDLILGHTPLTEAVKVVYTVIASLLIENGADVNKGERDTPLYEAERNGHTDIVRLLIENGADVSNGWFCGCPPLYGAARNGHTDIARLLIENGANVNIAGWFNIIYELPVEMLRRKFEADARDTKLSLERELDIQLRGKKTASLPKRLGNKLKTQTEMTSPRDIVEEGKCGKDRMTDVELGLNCLHLSPRCVQFKPCIMEESPGDSSIMHHDFKTINKRMDSVTLTDVGNAKQDYCVVVEKAKTHPSGDTIIIYGRKINEEGSGVGEAFRLATKDLKHTWDDEEVIAENVQIGSVVKYVRVGDEFLFQGNTKRSRWDGCYIWENEQLRHRSTTQGSLITFKRRPSWGFINSCYAGNTGKSLDINTILSQLQFGSSGYKAVVYQGIAEGFPTVKIENLKIYQDVEDGPSPACALISVKEATLEDRKIKFKTLLDEECFLKNNCRNNGGGGVEELPLPVQVSLSNQGVSNCVLLVEFGSRLESESWDSDRHYAVCEAVLISQPGPFALGRRQDSSDGILAGSSLKSYGMNRNPRGKCLIINNSEFQDEAYNRPGAEFDEQALEALFEYLSFDMEIHPNLDSRDMRDLVRTTASENHSESDALFVIVMSHRGNHDIVLGVDQRNIAVEEMMSELNAARCKRLEGKPKVFIFQVCRGSSSEFLEHERRHIDNTVEEMMSEVNAARCKSLEGKRKVFIFQVCRGSSSEFLEHERRHLDNTGNKNA